EIDRVERGHHEDAREQLIDPELGVEDAGGRPGGEATTEGRRARGERIRPTDEQDGGDRCPEGDRPVDGDVGEVKDPKADEPPEREQREDESDGPRPDDERHPATISPSGPIQHAPRTNSLSRQPSSRLSGRRWRTPCRASSRNSLATVGPRSTSPRCSGW